MEKIDFKIIVDYIFNKKEFFYKLSDDDKTDSNFFMVNRKFAIEFPAIAKFLNHKYIDKKSALDLWFLYFKKKQFSIPSWYWAKSNKEKIKEKNISENDKKMLMDELELDEKGITFLFKHYKEDVEVEIKKLKKYQNL